MDRKGYISDNLVNIRDRLKQQSAATPESADVPTPGSTPNAAANAPASGRAAERRMAAGDDARRDLACRVARDLSRFETEEKRCRERAEELAKLQSLFRTLQEKVDAVTPETHGALFAREMDLLRIEYFRLLGRCEKSPGNNPAAGTGLEERRNLGREVRFACGVIAGAIVLGAAIVAAVVALVFR